jgi:hypothetical protein
MSKPLIRNSDEKKGGTIGFLTSLPKTKSSDTKTIAQNLLQNLRFTGEYAFLSHANDNYCRISEMKNTQLIAFHDSRLFPSARIAFLSSFTGISTSFFSLLILPTHPCHGCLTLCHVSAKFFWNEFEEPVLHCGGRAGYSGLGIDVFLVRIGESVSQGEV